MSRRFDGRYAIHSSKCVNALFILKGAIEAADSFLDAADLIAEDRQHRQEPPQDEQDLLRAMLLFATAGLDAMVKQLVREALPAVIDASPGATEKLQEYIASRLKAKDGSRDHVYLAEILSDREPRQKLVQDLIRDLTSGSLQSFDELKRAASYFEIRIQEICPHEAAVKEVFLARNQISHDMDIDFSQSDHPRRPRSRDVMMDHVQRIFDLASRFLDAVGKRLPSDRSG